MNEEESLVGKREKRPKNFPESSPSIAPRRDGRKRKMGVGDTVNHGRSLNTEMVGGDGGREEEEKGISRIIE